MVERDWYGAYKEGWTGVIVPEAFCHPAKFSRGLIRRIYEHAFDQGWLAAGQTVLDPFAGIALGALEAMRRGLAWVGCELEQKFVDLGRQNIDLWNARYAAHLPGWGSAVLLQGDSRELARVVREAGAVISSPPYNLPMSQDHSGRGGGDRGHTPSEKGAFARYGNTPGQLEGLPPGDFAAAVISSPPFQKQMPSHDEFKPPHARAEFGRNEDRASVTQMTANYKTAYGTSAGQLAAMPPGEFAAAAVSSPPWEESASTGIISDEIISDLARGGHKPGPAGSNANYGQSNGQLGQESGDTFWSAAKTIVEQTHLVLRPGAVAIWVVKAFVRNKERVDFPGQWQALCEACGFEPLEWIRAWLVEDSGTQAGLFGEDKRLRKERKSFFRRLAEKKGSPPIDYEVVLVMRKPAGAGSGDVAAAVSSPPYSSEGLGHKGIDKHPERACHNSKLRDMNRYGAYNDDNPSNLANLPEGDFAAALAPADAEGETDAV